MDEKKAEGAQVDEAILTKLATESCNGHTELVPNLVKAGQAYLSGESVIKALGIPEELLDKFYEYAYYQYNNGLYVQAGNTFAFLFSLCPNNFDYAFARASALHRQKRFDEAIVHYNIAAGIQPRNPKPYYHIADCYESKNNFLSAYQALSLAFVHASAPGKNVFSDKIYNELKRLEKKMSLDQEFMDRADSKTEALVAKLDQVESGEVDAQELFLEMFMHRQGLEKEVEERMNKGKK